MVGHNPQLVGHNPQLVGHNPQLVGHVPLCAPAWLCYWLVGRHPYFVVFVHVQFPTISEASIKSTLHSHYYYDAIFPFQAHQLPQTR